MQRYNLHDKKYVTYTKKRYIQKYNPSTPKICYVHTKIQALNTKNMLRTYKDTNSQHQKYVTHIHKYKHSTSELCQIY